MKLLSDSLKFFSGSSRTRSSCVPQSAKFVCTCCLATAAAVNEGVCVSSMPPPPADDAVGEDDRLLLIDLSHFMSAFTSASIR